MATTAALTKLNQWRGHTFETSTTHTPEYLKFLKDFKAAIKSLLPDRCDMLRFKPNHFDTSGFIRRQDGQKHTYVFVSISDIRYWPDEWATNILIRTASGPEDYSGGPNNYTTLERFTRDVEHLLDVQLK